MSLYELDHTHVAFNHKNEPTNLREHCLYLPDDTYRLPAVGEWRFTYDYQDLIVKQCPHCKKNMMAWVGVVAKKGHPFGIACQQYAIPQKDFGDWQDRIDKRRQHVRRPYLATTVSGSVKDKRSNKWMFRKDIPVYR